MNDDNTELVRDVLARLRQEGAPDWVCERVKDDVEAWEWEQVYEPAADEPAVVGGQH